MAETRDVVIIGGGHNGLVTAFYLAKAGFKPLVLERRTQPGGAAITEEFHPGFRCSTLAHSAGPLRTDVIRDMQLEKHGLKLITPEVSVASLSPDGRALTLYNDIRRSSQGIANFSQKDAAKYPEFEQSLGKMGKVIGKALTLAPPNIDNPSRGDLWGMLKTGRSIRNLGKKDMYRLLRWGPMAVADLVAEYFETELLRATRIQLVQHGSQLEEWDRSHRRWPSPPSRRERRFAAVRKLSMFVSKKARPRGLSSPTAKRSPQRLSFPTLIPSEPCCGWSIRRTFRQTLC